MQQCSMSNGAQLVDSPALTFLDLLCFFQTGKFFKVINYIPECGPSDSFILSSVMDDCHFDL